VLSLDLILQVVHTAHVVGCDAVHIATLAIEKILKRSDETARLLVRRCTVARHTLRALRLTPLLKLREQRSWQLEPYDVLA
jgi:hypothetical protein